MSLLTTAQFPLADETRKFLDQPIGNFIEGKRTAARNGAVMPVINPATGETIAEAPNSDPGDVDDAVRSARKAFSDGRWRLISPFEKEKVLRRFAELLHENANLLMELDMLDNGMPRLLGGYQIAMVEEVANYYAGWPTKIDGMVHPTSSDLMVYTLREPVGVCAAIVPWNGPAAAALWKIGPALACGNCLILKPAEQSPLSGVLIAELALEAGVPPGVFNVVQGVGEVTGAALVAHPEVDKVAFTGSSDTGRIVQASAASRLKRVTLELGGKGANIIFADANLEAAAAGAAATAWANTGQTCLAGTRLLVERSVHDEIIDRLGALTEPIKLGSGFDPEVTMGPLISQEQLDRVTGYIASGRVSGASLVCGGERYGDTGYFVEPTIFTGVSNDMKIAREEIFGPVLSVLTFDTEDEAFAIANDTDYGLGSGLWTSDVSRGAHRGVRAIQCGTVWVNTYGELLSNVPYGGVKQSGSGRELGEGGINHYTEPKSVYLRLT